MTKFKLLHLHVEVLVTRNSSLYISQTTKIFDIQNAKKASQVGMKSCQKYNEGDQFSN